MMDQLALLISGQCSIKDFKNPCYQNRHICFTDMHMLIKAPVDLFKIRYDKNRKFPDVDSFLNSKKDNCKTRVDFENKEQLKTNKEELVHVGKGFFDKKYIKILIEISEITKEKIYMVRNDPKTGSKFLIGNVTVFLMPVYYENKNCAKRKKVN